MLSTIDPPRNKGHIQTESEGLEKDIPGKWRPKESSSSNTHIRLNRLYFYFFFFFWKGKFALFQMPATGNGVDSDGYLSKNQLLPAGNQWGKSFYRQEGAACRDSTAISDSHLQIGHQWSDQCHLGCFRCG